MAIPGISAPAALFDALLRLPRPLKRAVALCVDIAVCAFAVWLAFYLRLGFWSWPGGEPLHPIAVSVSLAIPIFITFGLYREIFRHADTEAFMLLVRAVAVYAIPFAVIYTVIGVPGVPRTIGLIQPLLVLLLVGAVRLVARMAFATSYTALWGDRDLPRVIVYGAGNAGRELASAIRVSRQLRLVGFFDDNPHLWQAKMRGVPVFDPARAGEVIKQLAVDDIVLALPSASRRRRMEILDLLRPLPVHVRTLPSFSDIASGAISVSDLREPDIEDLLGRRPIMPDEALLRRNIADRTVLVTGAGGSIGAELCRQILSLEPAVLVLFDQSEFNLYAIHQELTRRLAADPHGGAVNIVPLLGSVTDAARIDEVFAQWRPATILHAAAYKHVPLVEHNVVEGVRNNVWGSWTVARAAQAHGAESFILISTDKAVRPTNVMGASKRLAELVLQGMQERAPATRLSMVRFGNVLGSSGSVIPLFRRQIAAGGPVTVTHKDITRFFMTIPEAAQLVIQAGGMAKGGDVFLLDMGQPVNIYAMARNMIQLSGLTVCDERNPDGDIEIQVTGLRPGEKLYEELLIDETAEESAHQRIMRAREYSLPWAELEPLLATLNEALTRRDAAAVRAQLQRIVPEFRPDLGGRAEGATDGDGDADGADSQPPSGAAAALRP